MSSLPSRGTRIRMLSRADAAALGVITPDQATAELQQRARTLVKGKPLSGEVSAPAQEISEVFDFQSYFSDTLSERALFRQSMNEPIVKSTQSKPIQSPGYGIALHPSSETPVAIQFETGAQQGASQTYRLKPGEVLRPQGLHSDGSNAWFSGFTWGLPFGWLGGGQATLVVLRSPDAEVNWSTDHAEVVYHRIRLQIVAPAEIPVAGGVYSGPKNWPQRFPWPFAFYGTDSITQQGFAALGVQPTRTAMSLRMTTLPAAVAATDNVMRCYWVGADVWAQSGPNAQQQGTISLADVRATDVAWGSWAQQVGAPAPFNSAYQTQILTGEAERYAANAGALVLASEDADLQDEYVDIVRWGRL